MATAKRIWPMLYPLTSLNYASRLIVALHVFDAVPICCSALFRRPGYLLSDLS